jgi:Domain of unknown function (DUF397)
MSNPDLTRAAWRKSSYSGANGSCVEVAPVSGAALDDTVMDAAGASPAAVAVRDSKDRGGPALVFTTRQWGAFAAGIKNGDLELA